MIDIGRIVRPIVNVVKDVSAKVAPAIVPPAVADRFEAAGKAKALATPKSPQAPAPSSVRTEQQAKAYATLPPKQQKAYNEVFKAVGDNGADQSRLRVLLSSGTLTTQDTKGATLLDSLNELAKNPKLVDGIKSEDVLRQLIKDVSRPEGMSQGVDNYLCGSTSALSALATAKPAEYARLVVDMSKDGKVKVGSGEGETTLKYRELSDENANDRNITQRLLAVPLLEVAADDKNGKVGEDGEIITKEGGFNVFGFNFFGKKIENQGTFSQDLERMRSLLERGRADDQAFETMHLGSGDSSPVAVDQALDVIAEQIANQATPSLKVVNEETGEAHWVNVHDVDVENNRMRISTNQGSTKLVDADALLSQADALTYDKQAGESSEIASRRKSEPKSEKPGGGGRLGTGTTGGEDMLRSR